MYPPDPTFPLNAPLGFIFCNSGAEWNNGTVRYTCVLTQKGAMDGKRLVDSVLSYCVTRFTMVRCSTERQNRKNPNAAMRGKVGSADENFVLTCTAVKQLY